MSFRTTATLSLSIVAAGVYLTIREVRKAQTSCTEATVSIDYLTDERLQPGAYVSKGTNLAMIVSAQGTAVILEDAITEAQFRTTPWGICDNWALVRKAPTAPDYVETAA